jgi:hypothetical protein
MSDDIIVVGYRNNDFFDFFWLYGLNVYENTVYNPRGTAMGSSAGVVSGVGGSASAHATVNADLTGDTAKDDQIKDATTNVTMALGKVEALLTSIPANTVVTWDGKSMTAGALLTELHNTVFTVGDYQSSITNGGVGNAIHNVNGTNTDQLDFRGFTGPASYAAPTYANQQGLVGILLHELGHLSNEGYANLQSEFSFYKREFGQNADFYTSTVAHHQDYHADDEKFANDFSRAFATATSFSLTGYNPTYGYGASGAGNIFQDHTGRHNLIVPDHPAIHDGALGAVHVMLV